VTGECGYDPETGSCTLGEEELEVAMDKYSDVTEQKVLLRGKVDTSLPSARMKKYMFELGLGRFDTSFKTRDPNHRSITMWCDRAVKDTQTKRDVVDGETGDAIVTLKAKLDRCSQVFKYDLKVSHKCRQVAAKKGKSAIKCEVSGTMTVYKFKADQSTGRLTYGPDPRFGRRGVVAKRASWSSSSTIGVLGREHAEEEALKSATTWAGRWMSRQLRDIRAFQISAPIIAVRGGTAFSCLSKDVVEQDLPFFVVYGTPEGEKREGFVKARRRYDGCTLTPSLKKRQKEGEVVEIRPLEAQVILGSPKASMILREMPTMHLNVGIGVGLIPTGVAGLGSSSTSFDLVSEYNGGRYLGYTEVHQYAAVSVAQVDSASVVRESVGVLKRAYARFLFVEAGAGVNASQFELGSLYSFETLGIEGFAGIGAQPAPRLLLRLRFGYHGVLSVQGGPTTDNLSGMFVGLHGLITI
jgi:hypothetical protein